MREAVERYEAELQLRGGDLGNVGRLRRHLSDVLQGQQVAELRPGDLRRWRDDLLVQLRPATVNRTCNALKAAFNLAADQHEEITSRHAWEKGLSALPDASVARNVILYEEVVRSIVTAAYGISQNFGLLVEVAAVTGPATARLLACTCAICRTKTPAHA